MIKILGIMAIVTVIVFSMAACSKKSSSSSNSSSSTSTTSTSSTSPAETKASGNSGSLSLSEMDRFLDDYEKFFEDYLKVLNEMGPILKRIIAGDMTALAEMEKLQPTLNDFDEKYDGFYEKYEEYTPAAFTPAQIERLERITKRYADAYTNAFGQ